MIFITGRQALGEGTYVVRLCLLSSPPEWPPCASSSFKRRHPSRQRSRPPRQARRQGVDRGRRELERPTPLRELVTLPSALESPCGIALAFQCGSRQVCGIVLRNLLRDLRRQQPRTGGHEATGPADASRKGGAFEKEHLATQVVELPQVVGKADVWHEGRPSCRKHTAVRPTGDLLQQLRQGCPGAFRRRHHMIVCAGYRNSAAAPTRRQIRTPRIADVSVVGAGNSRSAAGLLRAGPRG